MHPKLLLGTAQEAREIGRVLDTHDTLQQIFDHRKLELERLVRGAPKEEIQEHLKSKLSQCLRRKSLGCILFSSWPCGRSHSDEWLTDVFAKLMSGKGEQ